MKRHLHFFASLPRRAARKGQAVVETAIVLPLMTFLILGVLQLAMIQHAKVMTEYAAYSAARAGIVWNADRWIMENAAIIALLPTYEGLMKQHSLSDPLRMLRRIAQRALLYQVNRKLPAAIDSIRHGTDGIIDDLPESFQGPATSMRDQVLGIAENWADNTLRNAITDALGDSSLQMVTVEILSPRLNSFSLRSTEIDFDDVRKGNSWRQATRLTIRVTYLYMMRIPFANQFVHLAWRAHRLGRKLYGAIGGPSTDQSRDGALTYSKQPDLVGGDRLTRAVSNIANQSQVYLIPLTATYTMRMQSNPYRVSVSESP